MKILVLMCGIPASGKSTFLKNNAPAAAVVSRDAIRFSMVSPDEEYFSKEGHVFKEFVRQIDESIRKNPVTFVDATHLNEHSRARVLRAIDLSNVDKLYAVVASTPLETCLIRNAKREGREKVPEDQIMSMYHSFTMPTEEEGFDDIYLLYSQE